MERTRYAMIPEWVFELDGLTRQHLVIYNHLALAAATNGRSAAKDVGRLCEASGYSRSMVYTSLKWLIEVGAVVERDGRLAMPIDHAEWSDQLDTPPVESDISDTESDQSDDPSGMSERASLIERVTTNPTTPPTPPRGGPLEAGGLPGTKGASFEAFCEAYPVKRALGRRTRDAWRAAIRRAGSPNVVLDAARAFAADPNLPADESKIPYPRSWLEDDRWRDGPLPPRDGGRTESMADQLAAAAMALEAADGPR